MKSSMKESAYTPQSMLLLCLGTFTLIQLYIFVGTVVQVEKNLKEKKCKSCCKSKKLNLEITALNSSISCFGGLRSSESKQNS